MFDRPRSFAIGFASLVAIRTAAALGVPAATDTTLQRLAHLDSLLQRRQATYDSLRRALANRVSWVELREPPFHARTTRELADAVTKALSLTRVAVGEAGGDTLRLRLARRMPLIGADLRKASFHQEWTVWITPDTGAARWIGARLRSAVRPKPRDISTQLIRMSERMITDGADSALTAWLKTTIPLVEPQRDEWEDAYTELATAPSRAARACRGGDRSACLTVLGVTMTAQNWLDAWYGPEDYRAVLGGIRIRSTDSAFVPAM